MRGREAECEAYYSREVDGFRAGIAHTMDASHPMQGVPRRAFRISVSSATRAPGSVQGDALANSYNDVPYTSSPGPARHPDRLATIGMLFGLDVAPVDTCRVLEFACGDGSNLVPAAALLPNARFVGFDFAAQPIARARAMTDALGLANVRLLERDLRDLPEDLGTFDYIIVHGLYSWLPAEVRAHLMPRIARHLAPAGVAFVSYNALPGSHLRAIAWDMLAYHTREIPDKRSKLAAAREILNLAGMPASDDDSLLQALRADLRKTAQGSDSSLAHDDLAEFNHAVHFHAFVEDAKGAGLAFLSEAHPSSSTGVGLAPAVRIMLADFDRLAREQYLDFLHFRHYRESLLCHAAALSRSKIDPSRARDLHAVASLELRRAAASPSQRPPADADVAAISRLLLACWPHAVPVPDIARACSEGAQQGSRHVFLKPIEQVVIEMQAAAQLDLRSTRPMVAATAGERPEALPAARWLVREHSVVPSAYHEAVRFPDATGRRLLALIDGTKTRRELAASLGGSFAMPGGSARLEHALDVFAKKALLVA